MYIIFWRAYLTKEGRDKLTQPHTHTHTKAGLAALAKHQEMVSFLHLIDKDTETLRR